MDRRLSALLVAAVASWLPTLVAGVDGPTTLTGAVLAVAVAALLGSARAPLVLGTRTTAAGVAARRPVPLVLTTRATDPTHHPLRPRAPGTV